VEGLIFRNANKIIGCDRWQINDSESFSVKPLNGSKGWSHNVTLLRREKGVMKIVFGSNDLSAPWIEYVDASETLSARAQEEARKRLEEEKRRLEELETKREAERRREEEQKAMFDAMHLASTTKLPDKDEEEEHQEKVTAFTLMEEDENEKNENLKGTRFFTLSLLSYDDYDDGFDDNNDNRSYPVERNGVRRW